MSKTVCVLGRQPAIGLAELESLFGPDNLRPLGENAVIIDRNPSEVPMNRLGGSVKVCKLLTTLSFTNWSKAESYLVNTLPKHLHHIPEGKIRLGLSVYGTKLPIQKLNAAGLALKRAVKNTGRSVRIVPNKELALNSAQVLHNQLTGPTGLELVLVISRGEIIVAQTAAVQDIEAYAARDQARPKRDPRIGMLPPKLAQIIINLATGQVWDKAERASSHSTPRFTTKTDSTVLDPFCGTGVVLQEALLMGYKVYGTDLETRMADYAKTNLEWLSANYWPSAAGYRIEVGDATNHTWKDFDYIACETYLGRPFSAQPKPEVLQEVMRDTETIHRKFLQNAARQTKSGFMMCLAVPAWSIGNSFKHLKALANLEQLGYTRKSFVHVSNDDLVYHRKGQFVARELVVIQRL
jgi:tRNA (guanine10-N2)-dimethyltransferase